MLGNNHWTQHSTEVIVGLSLQLDFCPQNITFPAEPHPRPVIGPGIVVPCLAVGVAAVVNAVILRENAEASIDLPRNLVLSRKTVTFFHYF
jgi:hypothetical protein